MNRFLVNKLLIIENIYGLLNSKNHIFGYEIKNQEIQSLWT